MERTSGTRINSRRMILPFAPNGSTSKTETRIPERDPIFVNGFSRGGTTILTNILASHPAVSYLGETHHLFKGSSLTDTALRIGFKAVCRDLPTMVAQREDFFSPRLIRPRRRLTKWTQRQISRVLCGDRKKSLHPALNQFRSQGVPYTQEEITNGQILTKNVDGMIFTTDALHQVFSNATFFGLVRHGLAVCESHLRRGRSIAESAHRYRVLTEKLIDDSERIPNCHLLRFEDILASPQSSVISITQLAGLDAKQIHLIRMQRRRVMNQEGQHKIHGGPEWSVTWCQPSELSHFFDSNVNRNQIARLSDSQKNEFMDLTSDVMDRLGYGRDEMITDTPHVLSLTAAGDQSPKQATNRRAA